MLFATAQSFAQADGKSTTPVAAPSAAARVMVSGFKVTGNSLLPQASLDAALAPFRGDRAVADLKLAATAVQDLYAAAGYGAVVAYLPEQSLSGGVVTIAVVEGRLSSVTVTGNSQFTNANVIASLPALATGATPRLKEIDSQIQIGNENPSRKVQVLLQPGQQAGQVEAKVTVQEQPLQRWAVGVDNTGNSRTGELRASVGWQYANLWGRDHVLSTQLQIAPDKPDAVVVVSAGYRIPLYAQQTVIDAYAAYSDVDGGTTGTAAGNLQFNGKGRVFGARATRYLQRSGEVDQRLSIGLDYRSYVNACGITGLPAGACGSAGESVALQPLALEYTAQKGGALPLGMNVSIHRNLQIGGGNSSDAHFDAVRLGANPHYTAVRLSASAGIAINEEWQVQVRAAGQFTNDALVPGEQFGIGGIASVRGYEERELAGDSGAVASLELIAPDVAQKFGMANSSLRPLVFVDGGQVQNQLSTPCLGNGARCSLASVGIGARFQKGQLQAQLFIATALKAAVRTEKNGTRAHVAVNYSF